MTIVRGVALAATACLVMAVSGCATKGADAARDVEAGPIWNQADAEQKCPALAERLGGKWNGQWVTTRWGEMSVCGIVGGRDR